MAPDPLERVEVQLPNGGMALSFRKTRDGTLSLFLKGRALGHDKLITESLSLTNCKEVLNFFCIPK